MTLFGFDFNARVNDVSLSAVVLELILKRKCVDADRLQPTYDIHKRNRDVVRSKTLNDYHAQVTSILAAYFPA